MTGKADGMEHESREVGPVSVVSFRGEVDLEHSPVARDVLLGCVRAGRHLAVDLSGVSYIDSSGIAGLIEAYQTAKSSNLQFRLAQISGAVRRVLELAHLDRVFPIRDSIEDAMEDGG